MRAEVASGPTTNDCWSGLSSAPTQRRSRRAVVAVGGNRGLSFVLGQLARLFVRSVVHGQL